MTVSIYHNPRCSKSRATLALLEERNIDPTIIAYLETPPTKSALKQVINALGIAPRDLLRKGEQPYKDLNLSDPGISDAEILDAMLAHPILIERPIVINGDRAAIGRPPESVLDIL